MPSLSLLLYFHYSRLTLYLIAILAICLCVSHMCQCNPYYIENFWGFLQLETKKHIKLQLHTHLTRIIRERCTNCTEFSEIFLRQGLFVCHGNPTTVTYRSTLINPSPTNVAHSSYMVSIIQNWVLTAPSLTIDWLLVRVNPNCPTGIASLDVAECDSGDTFLSDSDLNERIGSILSVCAFRELGTDICNL